MPTKVFTGARLITPTREVPADLVIEGTKICEIRSPRPAAPAEEVVDCAGMYLGPGLIDIHVHGGAGSDFVTEDPQEIVRAAEYHLSQGTTSIVPSSLSIPFETLRKTIAATREAAKSCRAGILGFHVEGIYLDKTYRGGHLERYVHDPDPAEYEPLIEEHADFITEWTLAPELPGALRLISMCREAGILPSVGHSQAPYDVMLAAIEAGLSHSTHFVCVMSSLPFTALRESTGKGWAPGVVEAVLLHNELTTEVIADGFHLHPAIIRLALKCKGIERVCLVSDSMKGAGAPEGEYVVGDQVSLVRGGIAIIKDRPEVIASSVTPLKGMVQFAHRKVGLSLADAWAMASINPARIIGVSGRKGSLAPGKDADLVLLDESLNVVQVYVKGEKIVTDK